MSKTITSIEGIGPALQEKFNNAEIKTVEALLKKGASKKGRVDLSSATGIDESKILTFVNMADLFRINGIASQFAELLKASGVDTVKELRNRNPENLHKSLTETNEQKKLTRVVPSVSKIEDFVNQAKSLDPVVTH